MILNLFGTRSGRDCWLLQFLEAEWPKIIHRIGKMKVGYKSVEGCGGCGYFCFGNVDCFKKDDSTHRLYKKCLDSDKIIFAIPTFCGHLASEYFKFWERSQAIFRWRYGLA